MNLIFERIKNRVLRSLALRLKNTNIYDLDGEARIGSNTIIKGLTARGLIEVGDNCRIIDNVTIFARQRVSIGRYTSINGPNTDIINHINEVQIGSFTSIARNVSIQEFNHNIDTLSTYHIHQNLFNSSREIDIYSNGPILIGNDVWIGTQCVILSGSKIGNGVIVAANSVVRGEIPPYTIVAGSPAKVIGQRFDEETVDCLQMLKWWEKPINEIKLNQHLFSGKLTCDTLRMWKPL
ncbi:CatB-related O-acetyltransferase [Parapedobacter lycopersici]|uniref:CatB-related O-acetyltransferase n=1 Tax=Parapedobacter lycopersici TaxID=1864939 RepID=UPI00214DD37C|nr:CatB-related O-acetyltransferase [Parapedobacter lycopersici]